MQRTVLYVITKATWGGAQRYVYDLATNVPSDYTPIVAFGTPGKLADNLATAGIRTISLPSLQRDISFAGDIASFFALLKLFREIRPDVIHLNSSKAGALGAIAARCAGIKNIVFTAHGWPFKEDRGTVSRAFIHFLSWITVIASRAVIVVSKTDEALGNRMPGARAKIRYIPLSIRVPDYFSRDEATSILGIRASGARIITNAELHKNKGIAYGIEAIAKLKERGVNVSYTIISEGEERKNLEALARAKNVSDRVSFLGFVQDAARYMKAFDLFLLPSVKEGMPYVLIEAAMAGLPIVTTNIVDPAFLNLLPAYAKVTPADPDALANAIERSLSEPAHAVETGSLEKMTSSTFDLY